MRLRSCLGIKPIVDFGVALNATAPLWPSMSGDTKRQKTMRDFRITQFALMGGMAENQLLFALGYDGIVALACHHSFAFDAAERLQKRHSRAAYRAIEIHKKVGSTYEFTPKQISDSARTRR